MRPIHFYLAFVGALSTCFGPSASAGTHRLLVLDIGRYQNHVPGSDHHRLLLLEIESGNTVASAELGGNTSLGVSPKGDVIATVSSWVRRVWISIGPKTSACSRADDSRTPSPGG